MLAEMPVKSARKNAHILVVDDDPGARMILSKFFSQNGCSVTEAKDGAESIERVREEQFDLIMLDLNMPAMHGNEALPRILDLVPHTRVIIMTANASYESKVETREMGAYDYLVKPITPAKLEEVFEKSLPDPSEVQEQVISASASINLNPAELDREAAHIIPERMARAFFMVVVEKTAGSITVATVDPHDVIAFDTVQTHTDLEVKVVQADKEEILRAIEHVYGQQIDVDQSIQDIVTVQDDESASVPETVLQLEADETPVIQLVNLILHRAMESGASDIHIEPRENTAAVRIRIDGVMKEIPPPPRNLFQAVVSRIKILGRMDIAERRVPQDGRARISIRGHRIDLRINTLPTVYGESVVIRLLDKDNLMTDVDKLGFSDIHRQYFMDAISRPFGMVYVTGPTGSGKTTTLYSALQHLNTPERKIITVEDPVEYEVPGVNQVHVQTDIGLSFANALRAILRQDPDVIMVGETRDRETAEIAVRSALTGHTVFSTLHTNDAPASITRLIDLDIEPFLISSALNLIIAQRLIRRICPSCREEANGTDQSPSLHKLPAYAVLPEKRWIGTGCHECHHTGYRGRTAIHELLPVTPEVRQIIQNGAHETELREVAVGLQCDTLLTSGLARVGEGVTSLEEVLKTTVAE